MRMESDEFDFLAPTYVRGFLKSYARYLRVDPAPLMEEFDKRFGYGRYDTQQIMALERHGQKARPPRKKMNSWMTASLFAAAVIVVLAVIGLTQGTGDDDGDPARNVAATTPTPEASPSPSTESSPTPVVEETIAAEDGITVEVVAVEADCWLLAAQDGKEVIAGGETIPMGESRIYSGEEKVFLRLGAPWAVELIVNGQNIGSPGGQNPINLDFPDDLDTL